MTGRSKATSSPFAWTTVLYLLLVFIAPLALLQPAHAQDEQAPLGKDLGTGKKFHVEGSSVGHALILLLDSQSSVLISVQHIRKSFQVIR